MAVVDKNTFANMDEVRGWGVRGIRTNQLKHINSRMARQTVQMTAGTVLFLTGLFLICDGNEKYGYWEGVKKMCSKEMDKAYIEDAASMGYKISEY